MCPPKGGVGRAAVPRATASSMLRCVALFSSRLVSHSLTPKHHLFPGVKARCSAAAATVGERLVIFGGAAHWDADDGRFLSDTYVVDLSPIVATLAAVDPNAAAAAAAPTVAVDA